MSLVSKDLEQIETLRHCLQLEAPISRVRSATGFLHKVQWHDHDLYDWFLRVGLTPAKSRTIGPLAVPDELFSSTPTDVTLRSAGTTCTSVSTCRWFRRVVGFSRGFGKVSAGRQAS